ncbi:MAG: DUF4340 domain-containing protein [Oscillospiraceae bacterium]|jgi:hypothetical protein|nr:DUF4340 domain-containing protein [Oscillospiraceae bacterium]
MQRKKTIRLVIILLAIVVVCVSAIAVANIVAPPENPNASATATGTPAPAVPYITREDAELLTGYEAKHANGKAFIVSFGTDEQGKATYEFSPKAEYFSYNTAKFRTMRYQLCGMAAMKLVEEKTDDLSKYGLDKPQFTLTLKFTNKTIKFFLGNATPVDVGYYAKTDDSDRIYLIGQGLAEMVMRDEFAYREIASFPKYTGDEVYENIDWVTLTQRDGTVIEIRGDNDMIIAGNVTASHYIMLQPLVSSVNDQFVMERIFDVVAKVNYTGIDSDITREKLKDYGLDKSARMQMRDTQGNSLDIVIGKKATTATGGEYYYCADTDQYNAAVEDGIPLTLLIYDAVSMDWLTVNYLDIFDRSVWGYDIHTVESVDYDLDGDKYTLKFTEFDAVGETGVEYKDVVGELNGKELTSLNAKRLYSRTLGLRRVGEVSADISGKADYVITLNMRNGSKHRLELVPLNERQYAAVVDGTATHYVYLSNIQNIPNAIARLMDDRDLPLQYDS